MIRRFTAGVAALMLVGMLGACGDDDDPTTTAADDDTTTTAAAGGDSLEKYCDTIVKIETTPEPDIDFETATPAQMSEAAKTIARQIQPLAEEARATAPAEIKADVNLLADTVKKITETGDFSAFETPEVEAASDKSHAYEVENCGWEKVDVTAVDYAFQGIPATIPAGVTSFELSNKGKEPHEIVLLRIKDDVKLSAEEIVKLPREEGQSKVERVAGDFAEPGGDGSAVTDLKPGRYLAACFVPVGGKEDGPPHVSKGMLAAFEVK